MIGATPFLKALCRYARLAAVPAVYVLFICPSIQVYGQTLSPQDANRPALTLQTPEPNRPCPFTGQITGDDVLVRSGPGTDYYQCGKLFRGDRVEVIREQGGWSQIVPPPSSFSWIHMQYLSISREDQTQGLVTGDQVPVYAGSELVAPIHSTTRQAVLRRGDKVRLLGEERDGYLKIACPPGAALWVSSRYVSPITGGQVTTQQALPQQPAEQPTPDTYRLDEFNRLMEQFKAETAKPLAQQDFAAMKKSLTSIAEDKKAVKASIYAKLLLERIANCEAAKQAQLDLERQDKALAEAMARIDKARQEQLRLTPDVTRFCVVGRLERSNLYSGDAAVKRYRVLDQDGRVLCYAQPTGPVAEQDLDGFIGQKVGLVGTVKPNPASGTALAEFTEIVKLP